MTRIYCDGCGKDNSETEIIAVKIGVTLKDVCASCMNDLLRLLRYPGMLADLAHEIRRRAAILANLEQAKLARTVNSEPPDSKSGPEKAE